MGCGGLVNLCIRLKKITDSLNDCGAWGSWRPYGIFLDSAGKESRPLSHAKSIFCSCLLGDHQTDSLKATVWLCVLHPKWLTRLSRQPFLSGCAFQENRTRDLCTPPNANAHFDDTGFLRLHIKHFDFSRSKLVFCSVSAQTCRSCTDIIKRHLLFIKKPHFKNKNVKKKNNICILSLLLFF